MLRGLLALFSSGIFLNPMVLSGIVFGWVCYAYLDSEEIWAIYKSASFYGCVLFATGCYILFFRRVYRPNGDTDWLETGLAFGAAVFKFLLASVLTISFFAMLLMDGESEKVPDFDTY